MNEDDKIREVMAIIGSRTSDRKKVSSAANARKSPATQPGRVLSEETKARMRDAQASRRQREKVENDG